MQLDKSREIWNPAPFEAKYQILVIGLGATGSWLLSNLARLGLASSITCFDPDTVELKNANNQNYDNSDIGKSKVEASYEKCILLNEDFTKDQFIQDYFSPTKHRGYLSQPTVVYICVDKGRKEIIEGLRPNPNVRCLIETRIGVDAGKVYVVSNKNWWDSYYINTIPTREQEETQSEVSSCGETLSIIPGVITTAAIAAQAIRWFDTSSEVKYIEIEFNSKGLCTYNS